MPALSAGILLHRGPASQRAVLLIHPGGPYWRNRDDGAWQIPKGIVEPGETPAQAALREFEEELGSRPCSRLHFLDRIRQTGGKWVEVFAVEGDLEPDQIVSRVFDLKWPPHSGVVQAFPEVDRAAWFPIPLAREKILASQRPLLATLERKFASPAQ